MPTTLRRLAAGVLAILLTSGLMACTNPLEAVIQKGIEKGVEKGIENETGGKVDIDTGSGAELPDGWPADLPVPPGKPTLAIKNEDGMMVTYMTDRAALDKVIAEMEANGYTKGDTEVNTAEMKILTFQNDKWSVNLQSVVDGDKIMLNYVVSPVQ